MTLQIGELIDGQKLETITGSENLARAMQKMTDENFSQLPVVDDSGNLLHMSEDGYFGWMVTYESILKAVHVFKVEMSRIKVSEALTKVHAFRPEIPLPEVLDIMATQYAVLVSTKERQPVGILTSFDTTAYFRKRSEDMLLVQDIEGTLKDYIQARFNRLRNPQDLDELDETIARVMRGVRPYYKADDPIDVKFDSLSLSQYVRLITDDSQWPYYQSCFDIDLDAFRNMMQMIVNARNALSHLQNINSLQSQGLKHCQEWLIHHPVRSEGDEVIAGHLLSPVIDEAMLVGTAVTSASLGDRLPLEEESQPGESGYFELSTFLLSRPLEEQRLMLTFAEIEQHIIADSLPGSARAHRSWWGNDVVNSAQAQLWFEAGWRVASVNLQEQVVTFARIYERQKFYIEFYSRLLQELGSSSNMLWKQTSPDGRNWFVVGYVPEGTYVGSFIYSFARGGRFRAELYIDCGVEQDNKEIFDQLYRQRNSIEITANQALSWERLDLRRACRIAMYHKGSILDSPETLSELRIWAVDAMIRLRNALMEPFLKTSPVESILLRSSVGE